MSRLGTGGTWSITLNHSSETLALWFRAVSAVRVNEVFAAGTPPSCSGCGNRVWRWDGATWSLVSSLPLLGEVRSAYALPPNVMYFGGQVDSPNDQAAIIRVMRQ